MLQPLQGFQFIVGGHQGMADPGNFDDGGNRFDLLGGTREIGSCELNFEK
jgi:hypothetical protein